MTDWKMKMPDTFKIALNDIMLHGFHGVSKLEQTVGNNFRIQVTLEIAATEKALIDDDLEGTVNYAEVYQHIRNTFSVPSRLLENVAWRISQDVLHSFSAVKVITVTVEKINPPMGADCSGASVTLSMKH